MDNGNGQRAMDNRQLTKDNLKCRIDNSRYTKDNEQLTMGLR